jgi:hypothetical protein
VVLLCELVKLRLLHRQRRLNQTEPIRSKLKIPDTCSEGR